MKGHFFAWLNKLTKSNLMAVDLKILFHLVILIMYPFFSIDYRDKFVFLCDCKPLTKRALTSELQAYS